MANRYEPFLDTEYIESNTAGAASVLSPTKSGSNPVLEGQDNTHFEEFRYISVVKFAEDDYKMWATVLHWNGSSYDFTGVARFDSTDGVTWTAPNLGLVSYGGNTNNNLILGSANGYVGQSMIYDPGAPSGEEYRLLLEVVNGAAGAWIYSAADADSQPTELVNPEPDLDDNATNAELEAKAMIVRADGRLAIYSVHRQSPEDDRSGLLGISESTDFSGNYYDHGEVAAWDSGGPTDQYYTMRVQALADDAWVAFVTRYNSTSETGAVDLFFSRDQGMTWSSVDAGWLPRGSGGAWDDSLIYPDRLIRVGDDWRIYYTGMDTIHDTLPKGADVGFATVGAGRLAEITGAGVVTSTEVWVATDGTLTVNADGSAGDVDVAILDAADDSPIGGFGGTISTDSFGTEFSLPAEKLIKVEITLAAGASLYSYQVESTQAKITRSSVGLLAEDDFDRGNNGTLRNNWSKFGTPEIVAGELELDVVQGSEVSVWQNPANVSAGEMLVQARMVQETSSARPLMMLRWWDGRLISGSDPNGFRLIIEGDRIRMDSLVNGSPTTIGQATSFGAAGSDVHLQAYVANALQQVWGRHAVNGEKTFSGTSTAHDDQDDRTAGMAGLSTSATQPMVGDDFIWCSGKTVIMTGLSAGQKLKIYAVDGTLVGSATESGGTATVSVSKFDGAGVIVDVGGWQYAAVTDASDNELARFERTPAIKGIYPGGVYEFTATPPTTPPAKPTLTIDEIREHDADLSLSAFVAGEGGTHDKSQYRAYLQGGDPVADSVYDSGSTDDLLAHTTELVLPADTALSFQGRQLETPSGEWSPWSDPVNATTDSDSSFPDTPSVLTASGTTGVEATSSAYSHPSAVDHSASRWQTVVDGGDPDDEGDVVHDSGPDASALEAYTSPAGVLEPETDYDQYVTHIDTNGQEARSGPFDFTTSAIGIAGGGLFEFLDAPGGTVVESHQVTTDSTDFVALLIEGMTRPAGAPFAQLVPLKLGEDVKSVTVRHASVDKGEMAIGFKPRPYMPEVDDFFDHGAVSASSTIDWSRGRFQTIDVDANLVATHLNARVGQELHLQLTQDGTGGRTVDLSALEQPAYSSGAGDVDYVVVRKTGPTTYVVILSLLDVS